MKILSGILAETQPLQLLNRPLTGVSNSTRDLIILLAAVAAPVLLLVIWAVFLRKRRQPLSGWRMGHASGSAESSPGREGRRRRRRRRREHRPRNPTLAETGGLPPLREERQTETVL